jgi:hypothetical protein
MKVSQNKPRNASPKKHTRRFSRPLLRCKFCAHRFRVSNPAICETVTEHIEARHPDMALAFRESFAWVLRSLEEVSEVLLWKEQ